MSIIIGVAVPEGIVLAGDSRMTYGNARGWPRIASDYTQKMFELSGRVVAGTFGWALLQGRNIHSWAVDFRRSLQPKELPVRDVAERLGQFFQERYNAHVQAGIDKPVPEGHTAVGFVVGGYEEDGTGALYEVLIPGPATRQLSTTQNPGASWRGQIDVITRLVKGVDPRLDVSQADPDFKRRIEGLAYVIHFARMTLQDAVDFAIFLARATIEMQRFTDGIQASPGDLPGVGGAIDVVAITSQGITWVQRKVLRGEIPLWQRQSPEIGLM